MTRRAVLQPQLASGPPTMSAQLFPEYPLNAIFRDARKTQGGRKVHATTNSKPKVKIDRGKSLGCRRSDLKPQLSAGAVYTTPRR